jgi:hypothetical protein
VKLKRIVAQVILWGALVLTVVALFGPYVAAGRWDVIVPCVAAAGFVGLIGWALLNVGDDDEGLNF